MRHLRVASWGCGRALLVLGALLGGMAGWAARAQAADAAYPSRPVTLIVPYGAGGVVDISARTLAKGLSLLWKQSVIVENKPGAAGMIGADVVAKAPADGYTLLFTDDGVLTSMPALHAHMPYDTLTDLVPVSLAGKYPYILFANASLHVKNLNELVAAAKARPGVITFGTNGVGSTHHLAWERFQRAAGISLSHIPYKSSSPAFQDLLANNISLMIIALSSAYPYLHDPRVVVVANNAAVRSPALPDLPTVAEEGQPKFQVSGWLGVLAPKDTPVALVDKINAAIRTVTATQAYRTSMAQRGSTAASSSPKALADEIRVEFKRNSADVKAMGIKPN